MKQNNIWFCLLFLTGIVWQGCSLDDPGTDHQGPDLGFQASQELSLTTLSWAPVKVTDFREYIILQSAQEIPASPEPVVSADVTVLKRIDDADVTSFVTSDVLFTPSTCYRLYVSIGDRFLYSPNLCVDHVATIFPGFYDRMSHEPDQNIIAMYDRNVSQMSSFNLETESLHITLQESFIPNPVIEVSHYNGKFEAFLSDRLNNTLRKYNLPNLDGMVTKNFSTGIDALTVYGPYVFATFNSTFSGFQVLNRSTLNSIDNRPGSTTTFGRTIAVFPGDPLVVLEVGLGNIFRYTINEAGKIISADHLIVDAGPQSSFQSATANGPTLFITGSRGTILNRDAEVLGDLGAGFNSFVQVVRMTEDEKIAVALINDNGIQRLEFFDIEDPGDVRSIRQIALSQAQYADVILENGIVYLFGVTFNSGQAQSFILKYPMPT